MRESSVWCHLTEEIAGLLPDCIKGPPVFSLDIAAESQGLAIVRKTLDRAMEQAQIARPDAEAVQIAVGEACSNAIRHGSPDGGQSRIGMALFLGENSAAMIVRDEGRGFDPVSVPVPQFETLPEGGMGIFLMRQVMDSVVFKVTENGTLVMLFKRVQMAPEGS